ncbi:MAG: tryptophan synthase subunit beta, partial [Calditrichaeota bacterium]
MSSGYFGKFGGQFVPEMLRPALEELEAAFQQCGQDPVFWEGFRRELSQYSGRPTPLYFAANLSAHYGRA